MAVDFQSKDTFGNHQAIHIRSMQVSRIGLLTTVIDYEILENFDGPDATLLSRVDGPPKAGIPNISFSQCVGISRSYDEKMGMATYTYVFEGVADEKEFNKVAGDPVFELDVTMREEPIETHPDFDNIALKYFWNGETREFARYFIVAEDGTLTGGNRTDVRATSPMYGVTSYLVPGVTYRRSYCQTIVPETVLNGIGMIVPDPGPPGVDTFQPSLSPIFAAPRNWLKMAPTIRRRGKVLEITEEYLLSGPRGVNIDIYGPDALKDAQPSGGGTGFNFGA